jgi:hypothetical protein
MRKLAIVFLLAALTGCSTTAPVVMQFPSAPPTLMEPADKLSPLSKEKPELSDIIENANENAGKYYQLREKYRAWQEWYTQQKQIFDSIK